MLRDYLPVLLQIIVVALFAVSALLFSILVGKRGRRTRAKDMAYECGMIPQGEHQPRPDEVDRQAEEKGDAKLPGQQSAVQLERVVQ